LISILLSLHISSRNFAQDTLSEFVCETPDETGINTDAGTVQSVSDAAGDRLNFYIISDQRTKFGVMLLRMKIKSRVRSFFSKNRMYTVVAKSADSAATRIEKIIKDEGNKKIGNIWIDSHGHYCNGYSSFTIGNDEFNAKNIGDPYHTKALRRIAIYCDEHTQIAIGSCYGGATFTFPGSRNVPAQPMNGDSLMIGMGKIFNRSSIYGCESWVMAKPGIFNNRYALAGYPLNKKFSDVGFKPVWERLGEWHRYQNESGTFEDVNTLGLNKYGEISSLETDYQDLHGKKKTIERKVSNLKPGLFKKFSEEPEKH
jgi:hypothetical protein